MPALPLDQLQITHKDPKTGQPKTSAALNPEQKADRYFVLYKPPPKDNIPALVEEYLERANFVANDLDWLLALPHDKFWCQVIFDETLQKCLDSYLHYVPRKFDEWVAPTPEVADMQNHLHRSVFLTFLRMSTHKESKDHFISPSAFGEILYNIFQNDEFDVFSRDSVDLSRVHKGRRKEENVRSLVNDKQAVVAQWQRYQKYSVVVEEVPLQPGEYQADDYEDEYDDTYDGNQVGANDADSDDELISRRP